VEATALQKSWTFKVRGREAGSSRQHHARKCDDAGMNNLDFNHSFSHP